MRTGVFFFTARAVNPPAKAWNGEKRVQDVLDELQDGGVTITNVQIISEHTYGHKVNVCATLQFPE